MVSETPFHVAGGDVEEMPKIVLLTPMTSAERNAIPSPKKGMVVYNSSAETLSIYTGTAWQNVNKDTPG